MSDVCVVYTVIIFITSSGCSYQQRTKISRFFMNSSEHCPRIQVEGVGLFLTKSSEKEVGFRHFKIWMLQSRVIALCIPYLALME